MFLFGEVPRLNWPMFRMGTLMTDEPDVDALDRVFELRRTEA
jgi:hypothetical protein